MSSDRLAAIRAEMETLRAERDSLSIRWGAKTRYSKTLARRKRAVSDKLEALAAESRILRWAGAK